ncbi:hypothetical protein [Synechococcus sp. BA-132 BA5]|uniref:hypothetical protein n=1 Tax=Synechococcus sp. BA-132 BA5 TaxID=3110252 RepID=UPI002B1F540B|nr:hypothetical protein [Synechococcus sp. BA-132 BA5]MEA5415313.1 hypothetical protein [Synechococcus sp. BA-132 BA5]
MDLADTPFWWSQSFWLHQFRAHVGGYGTAVSPEGAQAQHQLFPMVHHTERIAGDSCARITWENVSLTSTCIRHHLALVEVGTPEKQPTTHRAATGL